MPFLILAQTAPTSQSPLVSFLPIVAMLAIFYFILIVPQRRQMKRTRRCWPRSRRATRW
jgi:preprotein translocase subunit YajC